MMFWKYLEIFIVRCMKRKICLTFIVVCNLTRVHAQTTKRLAWCSETCIFCVIWEARMNIAHPDYSSSMTSSILCFSCSLACSKRPAWPARVAPGRIRAFDWLMESGALSRGRNRTVHWLMTFRLRARDRSSAVHWLRISSTVAIVSHVLWVRIKSQSIHFFAVYL